MKRMTDMRPAPLFLLITLLISCTAFFMAKAARADWQAVAQQEIDFAFSNPDALPGLYEEVLIDPLTVWYASDANPENGAKDANVDRLRARFQAAVHQEFKARGIRMTDAVGPGVLRLHVELVDLKVNISAAGHNPWADRFLFDTMPGRMTVVAELQDAQTGEVLFRLADLEGETAVAGATWDKVDAAFATWSHSFGQLVADLGSPAAEQRFANSLN